MTLDLLPQDAEPRVRPGERPRVARSAPADETASRRTPRPCPSSCARGAIEMTEASVVAVGTPQSFRQQLARAIEMGQDEVGWVQSATAAEELLINAFQPIDVLVLSPRSRSPTRSAWPSSSGARPRDGDGARPRPHVERAPAGRDARGHPRRRRHDAGTEELRDAVERAIVWASNLRNATVVQSDGQPRRAATSCRSSPRRAGPARRSSPPTWRRRSRRSPAGHRGGGPRHRHGRRLHVLRQGARPRSRT